MKIRIALFRFSGWLIHLLSGPAEWLDKNFYIRVDKYGTGLGGRIGLLLMRWNGRLLIGLPKGIEDAG